MIDGKSYDMNEQTNGSTASTSRVASHLKFNFKVQTISGWSIIKQKTESYTTENQFDLVLKKCIIFFYRSIDRLSVEVWRRSILGQF